MTRIVLFLAACFVLGCTLAGCHRHATEPLPCFQVDTLHWAGGIDVIVRSPCGHKITVTPAVRAFAPTLTCPAGAQLVVNAARFVAAARVV